MREGKKEGRRYDEEDERKEEVVKRGGGGPGTSGGKEGVEGGGDAKRVRDEKEKVEEGAMGVMYAQKYRTEARYANPAALVQTCSPYNLKHIQRGVAST